MSRKMIGKCRVCLKNSYKDQNLYGSMHFDCFKEEQQRTAEWLCIFCKDPARREPDDDELPVSRRISVCGECDIRNPSNYPEHS